MPIARALVDWNPAAAAAEGGSKAGSLLNPGPGFAAEPMPTAALPHLGSYSAGAEARGPRAHYILAYRFLGSDFGATAGVRRHQLHFHVGFAVGGMPRQTHSWLIAAAVVVAGAGQEGHYRLGLAEWGVPADHSLRLW